MDEKSDRKLWPKIQTKILIENFGRKFSFLIFTDDFGHLFRVLFRSNLVAPILQLFDLDSWLNCNPRTKDYFKQTLQVVQLIMTKQTACESSILVIPWLLNSRLPHVCLFIFSNKHFRSNVKILKFLESIRSSLMKFQKSKKL